MEQFDAWSDAEESVFNSEVASALESLGDLEAEAEEKSRREDLRLASEVELSPYHKGLSLFGEFQGGEIELEFFDPHREVELEGSDEKIELGAFEPSEVLAPHGEIELEAPDEGGIELEALAPEATPDEEFAASEFLGELEVSEEKPESPVVAAAPDGCKSCGGTIPPQKVDFCSYGCTKRAAFVGLPLKYPRTDKPRGRRGQP